MMTSKFKHTLAIALIAATGASFAKSTSTAVGGTAAERSLVVQGAKCTQLTSSLDGSNTPRTAEINTAIQTVCTHAEHLASIVMQQKSQSPSTYETLLAMNGTTVYLSPQQVQRMCKKPSSPQMIANCKTALEAK
jgi:hypothetical protein